MNLLITGAWGNGGEYIGQLQKYGHNVIVMQFEQGAFPCDYEWVEGVVCNSLFLYHPIEKFSKLKYIQLTSAGFDRVPMEYIKKHGIEIHNAGGTYSIPMAEFAVSGVLQLYKKIAFFTENQKAHKWEKQRKIQELYGKHVCIVGCGKVGTECAIRFKSFGCQVTGIASKARNDEKFDYIFGIEKLEEILPEADILILALPLNENTKHLMNEKRLTQMKEGAILVNLARGAVVDTQALLSALSQLGGAVLDVFEEEPLPEENPLWEMEDVIITPHNSFVGEGNSVRLWRVIKENLK